MKRYKHMKTFSPGLIAVTPTGYAQRLCAKTGKQKGDWLYQAIRDNIKRLKAYATAAENHPRG
jgi:hypothetical protein